MVRLGAAHRGVMITSYSRIKASRGGYHPPEAADDQPEALEPEIDAAGTAPKSLRAELELAGGPASGRFLHEVLEELPFDTVKSSPNFEFWCARRDVRELFDKTMKRHDRDPRSLLFSQRLVFAALTSPLPLGAAVLEGGVANAARAIREMEFLYPIPESTHPGLEASMHDRPEFEIRRGFIKGFIDLVFEHAGKVFILDWKSDLLPGYGADDLAVHVANNYALQGELYSLAIVKMLRLHTHKDYDQRFGGMLFCFVRGMASGKKDAGVRFSRPTWRDVLTSETALRGKDHA
jgi:exodeoxyribonuclease V beta subunit